MKLGWFWRAVKETIPCYMTLRPAAEGALDARTRAASGGAAGGGDAVSANGNPPVATIVERLVDYLVVCGIYLTHLPHGSRALTFRFRPIPNA